MPDKMTDLDKQLHDHQTAAEYVGRSPATLHQLNSRGLGPKSYKMGKRRMYRKPDLDAWVESHADKPGAA